MGNQTRLLHSKVRARSNLAPLNHKNIFNKQKYHSNKNIYIQFHEYTLRIIMCAYTHIHTHTHRHTCTLTHTDTHTHTHIHIHTHTHMHTHIFENICIIHIRYTIYMIHYNCISPHTHNQLIGWQAYRGDQRHRKNSLT